MSRPTTHPSGKAIPTQVRLSPHHLELLDSFVTPTRNRSGVVAWLLDQAKAGQEAQNPDRKPYAPPTFTNEPAS